MHPQNTKCAKAPNDNMRKNQPQRTLHSGAGVVRALHSGAGVPACDSLWLLRPPHCSDPMSLPQHPDFPGDPPGRPYINHYRISTFLASPIDPCCHSGAGVPACDSLWLLRPPHCCEPITLSQNPDLGASPTDISRPDTMSIKNILDNACGPMLQKYESKKCVYSGALCRRQED